MGMVGAVAGMSMLGGELDASNGSGDRRGRPRARCTRSARWAALRGRVASVRCKAGRGGRGTCGDAGPAQLYYLRVVVEALVRARDGGSAEARRCGREYGAGAAGRWWSRCTRLCGNAGGLRRRSSRRPRARYAQSTPRTTSRSARSTRTTTGSSGGTSSTPAARRSRGARRWRCHSAGWRRVLRRGLRLVLARDPRAQPHEPLVRPHRRALRVPPARAPHTRPRPAAPCPSAPRRGRPHAGTSGGAQGMWGVGAARLTRTRTLFSRPASRTKTTCSCGCTRTAGRRRHDVAKRGGLGRRARTRWSSWSWGRSGVGRGRVGRGGRARGGGGGDILVVGILDEELQQAAAMKVVETARRAAGSGEIN
ncbi:hypothetical protein C8J57DRAFT_559054 [Mycena rebaudengoi]|nr:hypothetical protein C8J57DRAFT_559054 [Mycena rebaudengoi]